MEWKKKIVFSLKSLVKIPCSPSDIQVENLHSFSSWKILILRSHEILHSHLA